MCASFPDAQTQRIFLVECCMTDKRFEIGSSPQCHFLMSFFELLPFYLSIRAFIISLISQFGHAFILSYLEIIKVKSLHHWHHWSSVVCLEPIALWSLLKIFWHQTPPPPIRVFIQSPLTAKTHNYLVYTLCDTQTPLFITLPTLVQILNSEQWTYCVWTFDTCGFLFAWLNFV